MNPRLVALALLIALNDPSAAAESEPAQASIAQPLKQFKDWTVGCDNVRTCTALGLPPSEEAGAYLKISRTGAADDEPAVSFTAYAEDETKQPLLKVLQDGEAAPSLPNESLSARQDGDFATASLSGDGARAFIAALRSAKTLTVQLIDGDKSGDAAAVSLAGAAAALLYMDAQQNRLGTVTALIRRGESPASSIPSPPEPPTIAAVKMGEIKKPPKLPPGVVPAKDESCKRYDPIVVRLSSDQTLWGICDQAAAYNFAYRFWIVGAGRAKPAVFRIPGRRAVEDPAVLTSPTLSDDGLTLGAENKGRGVGDCGEISEWAWDGAAFRLVRLRQMDECRGVSSDDWPTLYTAKAAQARSSH
ncbi:DUF1176 domain-containing protein [Methylocella sp.]|jgi:hypothetical protein|uniref:DUF1176 domain-containing protein n=1 Tax=Methylocella sp. TaxID=1978226 RepID=UPI003C28D976